ncbi:MAG: hypothetical protein R3275_05570 [Saprospiraceae bacterium]|nr:hypothetical protein [Saprospiraceae bacterium]
MKRAILTGLGFVMSGVGILSLVYKMIGLQLSYLVWIDSFGALTGLILRLVMIFGGVIIVYLSRTEMDV